jgi:hypothetical protein
MGAESLRMSVLGRLRRRRMAAVSGRRGMNGGAPELVPAVEVDSFEYVRVSGTALVRAAGRWVDGAHAGDADFTLEIAVEGHTSDVVRALAETGDREEHWHAAFPAALEAVEDPDAAFALLVGHARIDLSPPLLRELHQPGEGNELEELRGRVREAEAGIAWMQDQLARERDRRRSLEQEIEVLRVQRDAAASPALDSAERRYRETRYELSRVRAASEETIARLEEALGSARELAAVAAAEPAMEHDPEEPEGAALCPECSGAGKRRGRRCRRCGGSGYVWAASN